MPTNRELDHQYRMTKLVQRTGIGRAIIRLLMICAAGTTIVFTARALAGRQTFADLRFKMIAEMYANRWMALILSWLLTTTTSGWAIGERWLRKRHIKRVSSESSQLQKMVDPSRRSSHLMTDGTTRPEDE
jgi:hypothetical protein